MKKVKPRSFKEQNTLFNFQDFKKHRFRFLYFIFIFVLVAFLLTAVVPILWLLITSFKTVGEINSTTYHLFPQVFDITKVARVWQKANFTRYFLNSILVGLGAALCAVLFNGLMAYGVNIVKPKGYKVIHIRSGLLIGFLLLPVSFRSLPGLLLLALRKGIFLMLP